jgi:mannose-6-phosphate isomerase-like protein (cupin superfamily)
MPIVSPKRISALLDELWSPRVIAEVDDSFVKVAKVHGTFEWHRHDGEDELFFILNGALRIELETGAVDLSEGDLFVVPKGTWHRPVAESECHVLLLERKTTLHTGDLLTERTRSLDEQLKPVPGVAATC